MQCLQRFITNLDIARARDRTSKARKLVTEFDRCVQMARQHFGDSFPTIFEKIRATHQHLLLESTVHTENQDEESIAFYDKLNSVGGVLALGMCFMFSFSLATLFGSQTLVTGDFIANNEHMENDELDISCIRQVFQASENTKVENDPNLFNMGKGLLLTQLVHEEFMISIMISIMIMIMGYIQYLSSPVHINS